MSAIPSSVDGFFADHEKKKEFHMFSNEEELDKAANSPNNGRQSSCNGKAVVADTESVLVSVEEAARLCDEPVRTMRDRCAKGKYPDIIKVDDNGGSQYRIPVPSLPESAQFNYYAEQARKDAGPEVQRARAEEMNRLTRQRAREDAAAGRPVRRERLLPIPLSNEESAALWEQWDQASQGAQKEARKRHEIMLFFKGLEDAKADISTIEKEIKARYDVAPVSLWRLRKLVEAQSPSDWLPLLLPKWKGKTARAEFTEEAWNFIKENWGVQSKPAVSSCYRKAQERAAEKGWTLPSLDVVERRINALPKWWKVYRREGEKALQALYPSQKRDYTTLHVHDIWCSDGRKADVFCLWTHPDGSTSVGRPIIVGWADVRTRYLLGFEIGRTESADLIRLAFKKALEAARVIPAEALMDNGRGFASKLLTGGAPNRFRFKVKEEDVQGILTTLGVQPIWATPGHGQAKPIESFWRTLSEMDKRSEFRGAYVGNCPEARPEEWDSKKAIPIDRYKAALIEEFNAYHRRTHRGDGMNGRSPLEVYMALVDQAPPRKQPSAQQLRFCLLAAEAVRIDRKDSSVRILGNRYWNEKLSDLDERRTYTVRFNPESASEPVAVYDGDRFICEAQIIEKTGFRNQEAAKDHIRSRKKMIKGRKQQADAFKEMHQAEAWNVGEDIGQTVDTQTGEIINPANPPIPKMVELFRVSLSKPKPETKEENEELSQDEMLKLLAAATRKRYGGQS
jgi:putative transposase